MRSLAALPRVQAWCAEHARVCSRGSELCTLCQLGADFVELADEGASEHSFVPEVIAGLQAWAPEIYAELQLGVQGCPAEAFLCLQQCCVKLELASAEALQMDLNISAQYTVPAWSLFGLLVKRSTLCNSCGRGSDHYEMQSHVQVSVPRGPEVTLKRAMLREFLLESLSGNDGGCRDCAGIECRQRETGVEHWPHILAVHVRRWSRGPGGRRWVKNDAPLQFGLEEDFLGESYSLKSFVVHHGKSRHSGHYTAYCRVGADNFYHCDDSAKPVLKPWSVVRRQRVYFLFYERTQAADQQGEGSADDAHLCEACGR